MRKSRSGVVFFGDAARITLPGPDLGTGGELGGAGRTTLPRNDLGAGGGWVVRAAPLCQDQATAPAARLGGAGRTTLPGPSHGTGGEAGWCGPHHSARNDLGAGGGWVVQAAPLCQDQATAPAARLGGAGRTTLPGPSHGTGGEAGWCGPHHSAKERPRRRWRAGWCGPHHSARTKPRHRRRGWVVRAAPLCQGTTSAPAAAGWCGPQHSARIDLGAGGG